MIYVVLKPLSIEYTKDRVENHFLYTLSHEMGHVCTVDEGKYSGINKYKIYINELFNEYLSKKIMDRILWSYGNSNYIKIQSKSLHTLNFFLIEPFIYEYEHVFKEASINNSLEPLLELFGSQILEEYEEIIKEFYDKQSMYTHSSDIYNLNPDYVNYVKNRINNIYQIINQNKNVKVA